MYRARVFALCLLLPAAARVASAGEPKPKESVALARSWDAAVEEAKVLNCPMVVHSHGFYCGPCWGMHSALMLNKKYISFAGENTVEVIALQRLDEGIEKKEKRAETYKAKRDGVEVEYMVEFPGLTQEEMLALASSKANTYNTTGKIPYTCVVNPYTLEEMKSFPGSTPAGDVMDAVTEFRKALEKEHGKGVARKDVHACDELDAEAGERIAKGDYAGAMAEVAKVSSKGKEWPQALQDRLAATKEKVSKAAEEALVAIEGRAAEDKAKAKTELAKLVSKLKGTGLEDRARALLATL